MSYVVLGLVARDGPSTPYALKAAVARGVAHFWPFRHSQIHAETERLARLGLLAEIMADAFRAMAGHWERIEAAAAAPPGRVGAARGS